MFRTVKACKEALKEGMWEMGYMEKIDESQDNEDRQEDYFSDVNVGIVACGNVEIHTEPAYDAPPVIMMREGDYVKCLERRHPDLEYVGVLRVMADTCIGM